MKSENALLLGFDASTPRDLARRAMASAFAASGIASADLDARVLLCAALQIDHAGLVRDPGAPLGPRANVVGAFASRRVGREPVSRIIGYKEFWGAKYALGPATLDPRPDTETLVEAVFEQLSNDAASGWRVLDLGVGSGAILGALLHGLPNAFGVGVDLSPEACAVAQSNLAAQGLGSRGKIVCADWGSALKGEFDVIVSNPPYIPRGDIEGLEPEVQAHDPRLALDGGAEGLDAYRALIPAAARLLAPGGLVALEFGMEQGKNIAALLRIAAFSSFKFGLDLNGRDRIILARRGCGGFELLSRRRR